MNCPRCDSGLAIMAHVNAYFCMECCIQYDAQDLDWQHMKSLAAERDALAAKVERLREALEHEQVQLAYLKQVDQNQEAAIAELATEWKCRGNALMIFANPANWYIVRGERPIYTWRGVGNPVAGAQDALTKTDEEAQ